MELEDFSPDLPALARKELGEGALMYQFKKHKHAQLLLKHLATMQANEMLTDLTVRTKSKDLEEPFHSMLLAANSPVIRRSLTGKRFDCTSGVISLDLTKEQLGAFHDFLYKSELSTDQGMVNGFRQFATRYEMTYHEELCQERRAEREGHERMTVLSKDQKDVLSQLHDMCQKGELTTTCLEDCDGSSQFAVHSPLLAAASPVFQDMFLDDLLSQECSRYRLKDVTCNTLEDLIEFIYTGEVILEEGNVVDLLHAACDYEIPTLARACCDWLEVQLTSYHAIGIWLLARELQSVYTRDLEEVAKSFIITNFTSVFREDEFLELTYEYLDEIIRNDYLGVKNEEEVFAAVVNWIKVDEDRSSFFCDLLQCVRLEYASLEFLCDMEKDPHVANCAQCLQIVQRAQTKMIPASNRTPRGTRLHFDDEADFKRNLLYEFLESTRVNDDHLNETTEENPRTEPRKGHGTPDMAFVVNKGERKPAPPAQTSCSAVTSSSCEGPLKKNGTPDMRFASNKQFSSSMSSLSSYSSTSGPLAKDCTPDIRCAANMSSHDSLSSSGYWSAGSSYSTRSFFSLGCPGPLKSDDTPDMPYVANKSSYASPSLYIGSSFSVSSSSSRSRVCPLKNDGTPDMRFAVNRSSYGRSSSYCGPIYSSRSSSSGGSLGGLLKPDGTPDMRYASNRSPYGSSSPKGGSSYSSRSSSSGSSLGGPLKRDGTPDMRFAVNRSSYGTSSSYCGPIYSSRSSSSGGSLGGPLKRDGTPDMRYASNRSSCSSSSSYGWSIHSSRSSSSGGSLEGPLKSDGTPDMRYASNRSLSYVGSSYRSVSSSSGSSFGGFSTCGPRKSDGTPDMRFKANRR